MRSKWNAVNLEDSTKSLEWILSVVDQLTIEDQMTLHGILEERLERFRLLFPLQPKETYYIYSPYDAYGAARLMQEAKDRREQNG